MGYFNCLVSKRRGEINREKKGPGSTLIAYANEGIWKYDFVFLRIQYLILSNNLWLMWRFVGLIVQRNKTFHLFRVRKRDAARQTNQHAKFGAVLAMLNFSQKSQTPEPSNCYWMKHIVCLFNIVVLHTSPICFSQVLRNSNIFRPQVVRYSFKIPAWYS